MDCKEFREVLDLYLDAELSPEAMAAARGHLSECGRCHRVEAELLRLRQAVKQVVTQYQPPADLARRIRRPLRPAWRSWPTVGVAASLLILVLVSVAQLRAVRWYTANILEQAAHRLDTPHPAVVEGKVVCRGCELHSRYGGPYVCDTRGHRGALATSDGKIWDFVEGDVAKPLIDGHDLWEKQIRVHGKLYRQASSLEVENYELK